MLPFEDLNHDFMSMIRPYEVKKALWQMKIRNAVGLNTIFIKIWKYLDKIEIR